MQIIEIYGMRRSGHHAIIGWLKFNLDNHYGKEKVHYINDLINNCSYKGESLMHKVNEYKNTGAEILLVSYEDELTSVSRIEGYETKKFVIVRDIKNLSASRYKASKHGAMRIDQKFVDTWTEHTNFPNKIRFEDFLLDKNVRDNFSLRFGVENIDITDDVKYCSNIGSSFVGRVKDETENYLNRFQMIEIPEHLLQFITTQEVESVRKKMNYLV
jgi:hypothetical protein